MFRIAKSRKALFGAAIATVVLMFMNLLFGSRSMPFIYGLAMLVAIDRYVRRIPMSVLFGLGVAASALSFIIDHTRGGGLGLDILNFQRTGLSLDLVQHFLERRRGRKNYSCARCRSRRRLGLWWGRSFLHAFLSLMPTPVWNTIGFPWNHLRPSDWLVQNSMRRALGRRRPWLTKEVAESYLNFGMIGFVIFIPLGWFPRTSNRAKGTRGGDPDSPRSNAYSVAIMLTLHMRNDFQTYFRTIVWSSKRLP